MPVHRPLVDGPRRAFLKQAPALLGLAACGGSDDPASVPPVAGPPVAGPPAAGPSPAPSPVLTPVPSPDAGGAATGPFAHGVASGDPLADRIVLWTRVSPAPGVDAPIPVRWEIARDAAFATPVGAGATIAEPAADFTVHVDAGGLEPGQAYFYRFRAGDGVSPVGRLRTLPVVAPARLRLAVFSCANYPAGFFNVYADAARDGTLDFALHLGDYLYEYERGGYASADAAALGRLSEPATETLSLDDYRRRYAQYRTDPDLQALHAALPMIAVWDDHEFADDAWRDGALNHDPVLEGPYATRRDAAMRAWREWMPVRLPDPAAPERIWRSFDFGGLVALHMLDTRQFGRDRQLRYADFALPGGFDAAGFDAALQDPLRQMLGQDQAAWLTRQMAASTATWQVLGQQVLMARMRLPGPIVLQQVALRRFAEILALAEVAPERLDAQERAILAQPPIPYNLDAWDGYPAAREALLQSVRALDRNLVCLAGDTHNAWASNLRDAQGNAVGVEFGVPAVSSPGFEGLYPDVEPAAVARLAQTLIEPLEYSDTSRRGYLVVTFGADRADAQYRFVDTVAARAFETTAAPTLSVLPGAGNRALVGG